MNKSKASDSSVKLFQEGRENFNWQTILIENALIILWILTGAYLCKTISVTLGLVYLSFGVLMVFFVMRVIVCKNCYYHGKFCHTGWGKLSALYCKQGEISQFGCGASGKLTPIFYASMTLVPVIIGGVSLVKKFALIKMGVFVVFLAVSILSSYIFRKKACVQCKMRGLCPGSLAK